MGHLSDEHNARLQIRPVSSTHLRVEEDEAARRLHVLRDDERRVGARQRTLLRLRVARVEPRQRRRQLRQRPHPPVNRRRFLREHFYISCLSHLVLKFFSPPTHRQCNKRLCCEQLPDELTSYHPTHLCFHQLLLERKGVGAEGPQRVAVFGL